MENKIIPPIKVASDLLGGAPGLASVTGRSLQAAYKWLRKGRLPRTEYTGETKYAEAISAALGGRITKAELLQMPSAPPKEEVIA